MLKKFLFFVLSLILTFQVGFNNTYTAYAASETTDLTNQLAYAQPAATKTSSKTTTKATATPKATTDVVPKTLDSLLKYVLSDGIALVDASDGRIIYQKNGDKIMYPASTTKIMTSILVIENANLDDIVTVGTEATSVPADSSLMNPRLTVGEQLTVKDLLYAMLFQSSNDAAETLALYVGGTRENFIDMMNAKAKELGMDNTHFANPHGYQDENHYTTPYDLAKLAIYATKSETFMSIVSSTSYTIPKTNKNKARVLTNANRLLNKSATEYLSTATGMKTGTTTDAQECLVSSATSDGNTVVCVALKHPVDTTPSRFIESKKLLQYGLYMLSQSEDLTTAEYIYPSPTPTPELAVIISNPSSSISVGSFIDKINDFYSSLNIFLKIIVTIVFICIILFIILLVRKKIKHRRRKYRRRYLSTKGNYKGRR